MATVERALVESLSTAAASIAGVFCCGGSLLLARGRGLSIWFNKRAAAAADHEADAVPVHLRLPVRSKPDQAALEQLIACCEPAIFGRGKENVYDETYRKALALSPELFATNLDVVGKTSILDDIFAVLGSCYTVPDVELRDLVQDTQYPLSGMKGYYGCSKYTAVVKPSGDAIHGVRAELYKLNIYGKGGFFRPHADTPRGASMFGSLVVCLPSPFEGGELVVRHNGRSQVFDWSSSTSSYSSTSSQEDNEAVVHWAAFYSDCEHEILEVKSGNRITLTFNLFRSNRPGTGIEWPALPQHFPTQCACCPAPGEEPELLEQFWWRNWASVSFGPRYFPGSRNSQLDLRTLPLYTALCEAKKHPDFFPSGCILGFGCQHHYVETDELGPCWDGGSTMALLKGADAVLYAAAAAAGLKPALVRVFKNGSLEDKTRIGSRKEVVVALERGMSASSPEDIGYRGGFRLEDGYATEASLNIVWCNMEQEWILRGEPGHLGNTASWDQCWYSAAAILIHVPPVDARIKS